MKPFDEEYLAEQEKDDVPEVSIQQDPQEETDEKEIQKVEREVEEPIETTGSSEKTPSGLRIEIARERIGEEWEYHWVYYARNGIPIATNISSSPTLDGIKNQIKSIRDEIEEAPIVRIY